MRPIVLEEWGNYFG